VGVQAVLDICENRFFLKQQKARARKRRKKGHLALPGSTPTSVLPQDTGEEVRSVPTTLLLEERLGEETRSGQRDRAATAEIDSAVSLLFGRTLGGPTTLLQ
jgi:hypothetical protein